MSILNCKEVAKAIGRRPLKMEAQEFGDVSTDSRAVKEGDLFVALKGEKFDGNDFVGDAFEKGAAGAIVSRLTPGLKSHNKPLFLVRDTLRALGDIARAYRLKVPIKVIGITGSNGKTTTKEMTYHILSKSARVARAQKSFNNFIGVPLTIFSICADDEYAVIEMGTNAPGEIDRLAEIAQPNVGIITNVGETHLEGLGSVEGVARAKGELLQRLPPDGTAVLNRDNPWTRTLAETCPCRVLTFGESTDADFRGTSAQYGPSGLKFQVDGTWIKLPIPGPHNIFNALAAMAACSVMGMALDLMAEALSDFALPDMRLKREKLDGFVLINDAYNANPASVQAAAETLKEMHAEGHKVFVFGDMFELGERSDELHRRIGRTLAQSGIDVLWAVGEKAWLAAESARDAGMREESVRWSADVEGAGKAVAAFLSEGDVALFKASRAMAFERIIDAIKALRGK